ncbi:hypothetical protein EPO15_01550 [bacterium]|nr:MAG: hypothetical protein EPO15_01550 [bacterium]
MNALLSAALAGLALFGGAAHAAVPAEVSFSGRLSDPGSHNPVSGPTASLTFRLYDALTGGSLVWSEGPRSVAVDNGAFEARLGAVNPLTAADVSGPVWLEVEADGETLTPRHPLAASPYALRAGLADSLEPGSTNYVQNRTTLQAGAVVYAASGSVAGTLTVYGLVHAAGDLRVSGFLRPGPGAAAVTTAAGLWDAADFDPATLLPNASVDSASVTKRGPAVNAPGGLVRLNGSAFVPSPQLDPADVTQEGNAFNGASQLLQLDGAGLVPNARVDASSVVKRGVGGLLHDYLLDPASVTLQGNTFNAAGRPLLLDGAGLVANAQLDASSVVKRGAAGFLQNYQLDPASVTLRANTFNAANRLAKLDSGAGLAAPGTGNAVYAVVTSSSLNVTGTGAKIREQGVDLVPKGAVILWPNAACPAGWSEATEFRGYMPLGNCVGCTVGTTGGAAFTSDAQALQHDHNVGAADPDLAGYRPSGTLRTTSVTTTMPYLQLLFCRKDT